MNRQQPPKQTGRAPRSAGLTPQQLIILILVAVLGFAAMGLAAFILIFLPTSVPLPPATRPLVLATSTAPASTSLPESGTPQAPVLPAACLQQNSGIQPGKSARVIDQSTIEVLVGGNPQLVSYAGIQVPDASPLGEQATVTISTLVEGQDVWLVRDFQTQDAVGGMPVPRYIIINGQFLNLELVQQGLGQTASNVPEQSCANLFLQAEQQARAAKIGLWQPKRVPTATFMPFVTLDPSHDAPCDCISRPECSQFTTHDEAQACYNACNDYNSKLDEDRDGIACENLP